MATRTHLPIDFCTRDQVFLRCRHRVRRAALFFAAASFGLIAIAKLPLLIVLLGVAPLSIAAAVFQRAGAR